MSLGFTMTPKEVVSAIIECFQTGLVPFVTSSPGLGKSSLYKEIAEQGNLILIDARLSQFTPEDLMGLPMKIKKDSGADRSSFIPFETFPLEGDPIPKGKNGWLLLLDEFNSANKAVQAAAYKIVLDRMVGQAHLHPDVYIGCAGNLATDRAIVNSLSTAMQSRLIHMEMEADFGMFMDHAVKNQWDHRILAFLQFQPTALHNFKPDHTEKTFACPRTWEFASKLCKGKSNSELNLKLLAGTIGEGMAIRFHTYTKVFDQLPTYPEILRDPDHAKMPTEPGALYATVMMLVDKFTRKDFGKVADYVKRMPPEFQVVYFRGVRRRDANFVRDKEFINARKHLVNFLSEEDDLKAA